MSLGIALAEAGAAPDFLVRLAIREKHAATARGLRLESLDAEAAAEAAFLEALRAGPVALETCAANDQHYEVPPEFFAAHLGPRMKYSAGYWPPGVTTLAASELAGLDLAMERAGLNAVPDGGEGLDLLELGCGWGSLCLRLAERLPRARILAVSNSGPQIEHVRTAARRLGFDRLEARRADMNDFDPGRQFDRIVSVEMFEHLRNWPEMFRRVAGWLKPGGRFFLHVFCRAGDPERSYLFDSGESDWMGRHFFTGGMMPSAGLAARCQDDLILERRWLLDGRHYQKTCEAWLASLDAARDRVLPVLAKHEATRPGGGTTATVAFNRWRMFYMACAELFGYGGGREWCVGHSLFRKREAA